MAKVRVDFSDVESFEAIPDGQYACVVAAATLKDSKSSDHPYINLELDVAEGEHEGRKLWAILSLHPKALFRTLEGFKAFGIEDEKVDLEVDEDGTVLEPEFTGKAVLANVETREYEGKLRNGVTDLYATTKKKPAAAAKAKTSSPATPAAKKPAARKFA